ncbi:MAG: Fic family protein [Muribaculaceae bacterium]|nr:Fic family protein [Muribaculaceae bacterium]
MVKATDFASEYKTVQDPSKQEKARNWDIAIGLQRVDGLTPSRYLYQVARDNIEGKITHADVAQSLYKYYQTDDGRAQAPDTMEADHVSNRIAELLGNPSFTFSLTTLLSIHEYLFRDSLPDEWAGRIRDKDITKAEGALNGDTVRYAWHADIEKTLEYDFDRERRFSYAGLSPRAQVGHIAEFISGIWQIHPFREGNTRTTAVFAIKYLRSKGFQADNELFKNNAEYFRNALVRANYENVNIGISRTMEYLHRFFGNLLLGESNALNVSDTHINIANSDVKIREKDREKTREKLKKSERAFLDAIMPILIENGEITTPEAITITNKSPQRVWQQFVALVDAGILVAIGEKKGRRYRLVK